MYNIYISYMWDIYIIYVGYTGYIDSCIWVYRFMYMGMYIYICENTRYKKKRHCF